MEVTLPHISLTLSKSRACARPIPSSPHYQGFIVLCAPRDLLAVTAVPFHQPSGHCSCLSPEGDQELLGRVFLQGSSLDAPGQHHRPLVPRLSSSPAPPCSLLHWAPLQGRCNTILKRQRGFPTLNPNIHNPSRVSAPQSSGREECVYLGFPYTS